MKRIKITNTENIKRDLFCINNSLFQTINQSELFKHQLHVGNVRHQGQDEQEE